MADSPDTGTGSAPPAPRHLALRWLGLVAAGFALFLLLLAFGFAFTRTGVINQMLAKGLQKATIQRFLLRSALTEMLPLYVGTVFLLGGSGLFLAKTPLFMGGDWHRWGRTHAFWTGMGFGLATHLRLWWEVPTTLWVLPGVSSLPMGAGLLLMAAFVGACFLRGLRFSNAAWWRKAIVIGLWTPLAWTSVLLPRHLARRGLDAGPSGHPARVLMLGIDGLRQDTAFQCGLQEFHGFQVSNGYCAIPATRIQWSILWGGDPGHYSVGTLFPAKEEFEGSYPFTLVEAGNAQGLKSRFYIDDGGTIALAERNQAFDQTLMPARGWENFLNSNAAAHFPLFALWLDALRVFPSTTPWTPPDLGLRSALSLGRGADWVMYHSCLAHQPIFMTRQELGLIPRWWALPARRMAPYWTHPRLGEAASWRPAYGPYLAYQIRVHTLLSAWGHIWNALPSDPDYGSALRIMATDHGERFYHLQEHPPIQMGGSHGLNLDPWEVRIPFVFDQPGLVPGSDGSRAVSLLEVRNAIARRLLHQEALDIQTLLAKDYAPLRMHAIGPDMFKAADVEYRELSMEELGQSVGLLPEGVWMVEYGASEAEREKDLTVAEAKGRLLKVWRPLKKGGARRVDYDGYRMTGYQDVDEASFQEARARIFSAFKKPWTEGVPTQKIVPKLAGKP